MSAGRLLYKEGRLLPMQCVHGGADKFLKEVFQDIGGGGIDPKNWCCCLIKGI